MPFPNEHAARIKNPGQFEDIRRSNDKLGAGIDAIFGIKTVDGERVSEIQAIRFDKKKFSPDEAKAWLKDNDFKPIEFEPASEKLQEAGLSMQADGSCPAGYPVKRKDEATGEMKCFKGSPLRESSDLPGSKAGFSVQDLFSKMAEIGRKFTKEEAGYLENSHSADTVCGSCRFFLRDSFLPVGSCQIIEGDINWFGTSDFYISAAAEAQSVFRAESMAAQQGHLVESAHLSSALKQGREKMGLTVAGYSKKFGISPAMVSGIESGRIKSLSNGIRDMIAKSLGIPPKQLENMIR